MVAVFGGQKDILARSRGNNESLPAPTHSLVVVGLSLAHGGDGTHANESANDFERRVEFRHRQAVQEEIKKVSGR
jgi:hypothetical protein